MIALPSTWPILGAVVAAAFAVGAAGGWTANGWRLDRQIAELKADHASLVAKAERETREAEAREREKESRWNAAQQENARVSNLARARVDADRRVADTQHQRMLNAARAAAVGACPAGPDTPSAGSGAAAGGSVRAMADVLGEVDRTAGEMASAAEAARGAGLACERHADSLTQ